MRHFSWKDLEEDYDGVHDAALLEPVTLGVGGIVECVMMPEDEYLRLKARAEWIEVNRKPTPD